MKKPWEKIYVSCGKLVLAGEYNLLNGGYGISLALNRLNTLYWRSSPDFFYTAKYLNTFIRDRKILKDFQLSGTFVSKIDWYSYCGWGSSGACLSNIAKFLQKNPSEIPYSGSGIDIYTSFHMKNLLYKKDNPQPISIHPKIKQHLYFGVLGQKVKSPVFSNLIFPEELNYIILEISQCQNIDTFISLLAAHDKIVSRNINMPCFFESGAAYSKYLGTWGGDTVLLIDPKKKKELYDSSLLV